MTAEAILALFRHRGVTLSADGRRLRFRGPKGAVTPNLREELRNRKRELLALLGESASLRCPNAPTGRGATVRAAPCKCGSGMPRERIWVKEFGLMENCRECRKRMVPSVREAAGDPEPQSDVVGAADLWPA
jgi:hypothetical protein